MYVEKWFPEKGYGFVCLNDGRRAFFHISELVGKLPRGSDLSRLRIQEATIKEEKKGPVLELVHLLPTGCSKARVRNDRIWFFPVYGDVVSAKEDFFTFWADSIKNGPVRVNNESFEKYMIPENVVAEADAIFTKVKKQHDEEVAYRLAQDDAWEQAGKLQDDARRTVLLVNSSYLTFSKVSDELRRIISQKWKEFFDTMELAGENIAYKWYFIPEIPRIEASIGEEKVIIEVRKIRKGCCPYSLFVTEKPLPYVDDGQGDGYGWQFEDHSERFGW